MALASMEQIRPGPTVFPFFAPQFAPNMASMAPERFRFPLQPPFQFNPAVFHALHAGVLHQSLQPNVASLPRMPPASRTPMTPVTSMAPLTPVPTVTLTFSQEEVDMVLYGYTRGRSSDRYHGHALSGLKFSGDLTHGIDRILAQQRSSPDNSHNISSGSSSSSSDMASKQKCPSTGATTSKVYPNNPGQNGGAFIQNEAAFREEGKSPVTFWSPVNSTHAMKCIANNSNNDNNNHTKNNNNNNNNNNSHKNVNGGHSNSKTSCGPGSSSSSSSGTISSNSKTGAKIPLDVAALDLQDGLAIYQTHFAGTVHCGVFCTKTVISRSTRYGPFKGRIVHTSEVKTHDDNTCMWEVFQDGKLSHFIDGRGSMANWMAYINCARYAQEQNLIAIQVEGEIWYETCKDIPQGTELLVWYGDCYLQFMGVPVALKEMADGGAQEEADTSEGFQCERCGKVFAYKYYRDKHLKYTRCVDQGNRKYPCHLCSRSFEKRDRLRIHILHVHEKHRPHKCLVCGKSFSQSSSLNKHMRVHSGERPYKCVYCNKAFTASSILRTHIRQHSGEKPFKCKHCGKAFASHAAHDSHVRRTHAKERLCICNICGKSFQQPYELKFHMGSHMNQ